MQTILVACLLVNTKHGESRFALLCLCVWERQDLDVTTEHQHCQGANRRLVDMVSGWHGTSRMLSVTRQQGSSC
jgi:hypothetical protein